MSLPTALKALGFTGVANNIRKRYVYNTRKQSWAQRQLASRGARNYGIYANSQSAAKALAYVLSYSKGPEVHGSGYYGHYHYKTHTFHIWYGKRIYY